LLCIKGFHKMPIESASYVHQLEPANPAGSDPLADADNHIRLIKGALKATFPNLTGPVLATQDELRAIAPIGFIGMWSGTVAAIPPGWVLCDGRTVARTDGMGNITAPDLRNRFVMGAGTGTGYVAPGTTGGSQTPTGTAATGGAHTHTGTTSVAGTHSHSGATASHALTTAQLPAHSHTVQSNGAHTHSGGSLVSASGTTSGVGVRLQSGYQDSDTSFSVNPLVAMASAGAHAHTLDNTGSGSGHTHGISTDGDHSHTVTIAEGGAHSHTVSITDGRPPFFALCFIMKI
jgi:microcystin-dependent protein